MKKQKSGRRPGVVPRRPEVVLKHLEHRQDVVVESSSRRLDVVPSVHRRLDVVPAARRRRQDVVSERQRRHQLCLSSSRRHLHVVVVVRNPGDVPVPLTWYGVGKL